MNEVDMRILLLGKNGQLGWELRRSLVPLGEIIAWDVDELDLTQVEAIGPAVREAKPQVIVNASAYTAVDKAEQEPEIAKLVNADAPTILAQEAKVLGAWFLHYSTDYVFDGEKSSPYIETDEPNPINVYGRTKLEGEHGVLEADGLAFILRTSWVYSLRQESFVTKVLKWSREQETMRVVDDQIGSPSWARMLAEVTAALLAKSQALGEDWLEERRGVYHLAGNGAVSRYEWAKEILRLDPKREEQVVQSLQPVKSDRFPTAAKRPAFTVLDCALFEEAFDFELLDWHLTLRLAVEEFLSI
jgi:dTDP-4-dehydrorhamnose reductase